MEYNTQISSSSGLRVCQGSEAWGWWACFSGERPISRWRKDEGMGDEEIVMSTNREEEMVKEKEERILPGQRDLTGTKLRI
jgi:hypothetical protein